MQEWATSSGYTNQCSCISSNGVFTAAVDQPYSKCNLNTKNKTKQKNLPKQIKHPMVNTA